jgi:predicted signal transduction protein with EAL and GGDEF domain
VHDVLSNQNDATIARMILALGRNLGLTVIAEGVETEGQRRFLVENGCHAYQGYLFGRPMEAACFETYLLGICESRKNGNIIRMDEMRTGLDNVCRQKSKAGGMGQS